MEQRRLIIGGVGGIGKTQLAIAYAKQKQDHYDTTFWLDATSEATLKDGFKSIIEEFLDVRDLEDLDDRQVIAGVKQWLSHRNNTKWLLIFDNYDEPASYDLSKYYPQAFQGTVIITTRLPNLVEGPIFDVKALDNVGLSLQILQTRSQRANVSDGESDCVS